MIPGCRRQESRKAAETAAAGATPKTPPPAQLPQAKAPPPEGAALTPVRVDPSLEIRTLTGLRPFRPSGFVVRREEREGRTLIHNYGHGGGGMSLSWGCAHLAVRMEESVVGKYCAVIGGGVMGLSTAWLLLQRGAHVTLYTRDLPPHTTSNIAGAQWWPVSVYDGPRRTEAFSAQFIEAANFAHRYFQNLVGPRWGVRWLPNYYLSEGEPANGWLSGPGSALHHLQIGFRDFGPGGHVFPARHVRRFYSMLIEPATYLATLLRDVRAAGARLEIREFASAEEILRLPQSLIFHCSGLGARTLFGDEELIPAKGQLSVLMPQPEVAYNLITDLFYMFPRSDGIILGGTFERGATDLAPDPAARQAMLDGHRALFAKMAEAQHAIREGNLSEKSAGN